MGSISRTTVQHLLDDDASILFCTASGEQRSKLHIHTLIHAFYPDSGLAYYKLRKRKCTLLDRFTRECQSINYP